VTEADIAANHYIVEQLSKLTPDIPVIAEENTASDNVLKHTHECFWLVDPLDGTRAFIRGESEYTVNIALIKNDMPIGGTISAPVGERGYFTGSDGKAYKQIANGATELITMRSIPPQGMTVLTSMLHYDGKTRAFINNLPKVTSIVPFSSSIKFCMIAEGKGDIYPRFGKTMEWDTAAGHALMLAAGGQVVTEDYMPLRYRKKGFVNPNFIALAQLI
jgi:3'(2'), 5'-bisphosphate nucleotidase